MSKSIKSGVTAASYTGGVAETYIQVPSLQAGTQYVNQDDASGLRQAIRLTGRAPSYAADGTVKQKMKTSAVFSAPIEDATTGEIRYASVRVEVIVDPRDHASMMTELQMVGCQMLSEADFANLYLVGSEE